MLELLRPVAPKGQGFRRTRGARWMLLWAMAFAALPLRAEPSDPILSIHTFSGADRLVLWPAKIETILFSVESPDSLVDMRFGGFYPTQLLQLGSAEPGPAWEGTSYTSQLFDSSIEEETGQFSIRTGITGVPEGLTWTGVCKMAYVEVIGADSLPPGTLLAEGKMILADSLCFMTSHGGQPVPRWSNQDLPVVVAYPGDLATANLPVVCEDVGMRPLPDGRLTFDDLVVFTLAWNEQPGSLNRHWCDLAPTQGAPPNLRPLQDGWLRPDDVAAFRSNWQWFAEQPGARVPAFGMKVGAGERVSAVTSPQVPATGDTLLVELSAIDIEGLTAAAVRLAFEDRSLALLSFEPGELLGAGAEELLLGELRDRGLIELCMGRLAPDSAGTSGSGVLARARLLVLQEELGDFGWGYDLRSTDNIVLARNWTGGPAYDPPHAEKVRLQTYPNPACGATHITLRLSTETDVRLAVLDPAGRLVRTLHYQENAGPGLYRFFWDGAGEKGQPQPAGVYFVRLGLGSRAVSRRIVLLR